MNTVQMKSFPALALKDGKTAKNPDTEVFFPCVVYEEDRGFEMRWINREGKSLWLYTHIGDEELEVTGLIFAAKTTEDLFKVSSKALFENLIDLLTRTDDDDFLEVCIAKPSTFYTTDTNFMK